MKRPHFRTNVLLKNIVGKDLINDDNIAVLELVKNAYDAGAKKVDLYFRNLSPLSSRKTRSFPVSSKENEGESKNNLKQPEILLVDTGSGMTRNDIEERWLNIAFSEKKYVSKKGKRIMAGNKGVGRFSCDRLGKKLDLFTRISGGDIIYLSINWEEFEKENQPKLQIQQIPVVLKESDLDHFKLVTGLSSLTKGTVLHITELRSNWDKDALMKLRRHLERLFNPNQAFEKEKFQLFIIAPEFKQYDSASAETDRVNGEITNEIFERLNFKTTNIESEIDTSGEFITTVLRHDGKVVYKVVEKNDLPLLRSVKTVIYYLNPYKKAYFKKQTGLDSVEFGSIFLFVNGFRIPPYGDRGDDWLGLDVRKTQRINSYISTRDIVGRIEIEDLENEWIIISSREGIVKDEAYEQLVNSFYYKSHRRLETFVVQGLDWDSVPEEIRKQLRAAGNEPLKWTESNEQYVETAEQKSYRIGEKLLSVLSTDPKTAVSIYFDTGLLEQVSTHERETVKRILSHFDKYDSKVIDAKLFGSLSKLKKVVEKQAQKIKNLERTLERRESQVEELKIEAANKESENIFLKSITTLDQDNLLNFLHQIGLDSSTIKNTIERLLNKLAKDEPIDNEFLADALERVSFANKKILAISQFATKANFKFQSQSIRADLVSFVEQYLLNVAKDYIGASLKIDIEGQDAGPFEIKLKPIEVSIIFDNLLSNAKKAGAKEVLVRMKRVGQNCLEIVLRDNGKGFSSEVRNVEDIFRKGFTTTTGSGLGLYHVSQSLKAMNGKITAAPAIGKGLEFTIRVEK